MCELMTIAAAIVFSAVCAVMKGDAPLRSAVHTTALAFWGAALMWGVDCVANRMGGEPLLDMSREDAVLGCIVIASGLLLFAVLAVFARFRARTTAN